MDMATIRKRWTAAEVRALPYDGRRFELIDGVLIVNGVEIPSGDLAEATRDVMPGPSWRHQDVVISLLLRLHPYVREHGIGHVLMGPADTEPAPETVAQPDLFVVPLVAGRAPDSWDDVGRMLLAIEVVSPRSARTDRGRKRALYQRAGVPEYWIVDADARHVERWRPGDEAAEVVEETLVWQPDAAKPELRIALAEVFGDTLGE